MRSFCIKLFIIANLFPLFTCVPQGVRVLNPNLKNLLDDKTVLEIKSSDHAFLTIELRKFKPIEKLWGLQDLYPLPWRGYIIINNKYIVKGPFKSGEQLNLLIPVGKVNVVYALFCKPFPEGTASENVFYITGRYWEDYIIQEQYFNCYLKKNQTLLLKIKNKNEEKIGCSISVFPLPVFVQEVFFDYKIIE